MATRRSQNYINHIALVLDMSASMGPHAKQLLDVVDAQVTHLARRSKELDQETRITVYTFNNGVECVIYDKDVLRLPSIRDHYRPNGMTALIDATLKSQEDLAHTWEGYGDHAFLTYVLTDGYENYSRSYTRSNLSQHMAAMRDNWTMAVLVPDQPSAFEAKGLGFPAANVAVWDTTTSQGLEQAAETIKTATDNFMTSRAQGVRGSRSLFTIDANALTGDAVKAANLTPMDPGTYVLVPVIQDIPIKDMVEQCTTNYRIGNAYYQLNSGRKPKGRAGVKVQGNKRVIVIERATNKAFSGPEARKLIGLPDHEVTVDPTKMNADYDVYVQSTSLNRKLFVGTKLLMLV